ncbi:MAG: type II toxin-antitoxin system VapC family toxin [Thermomicrobiales bacterium]
MSVLLDTNILSELLTTAGNRRVKATVKQYNPAELFVSVISLGEIQKGVSLLPVGRRQHELAKWFLEVQQEFMSRVIPVDIDTAIIWGELSAQMRRTGENIAAADLLITATALQHGLTVMTRNVHDFAPTGVALINPWLPLNAQ